MGHVPPPGALLTNQVLALTVLRLIPLLTIPPVTEQVPKCHLGSLVQYDGLQSGLAFQFKIISTVSHHFRPSPSLGPHRSLPVLVPVNSRSIHIPANLQHQWDGPVLQALTCIAFSPLYLLTNA